MLVDQLDQVVGGEWRAAGEQGVEQAAERVEVAPLRGRLARGLLGRDERGRGERVVARWRDLRPVEAGDTGLRQLDSSVSILEQVRRLQVAVENATAMGVSQ